MKRTKTPPVKLAPAPCTLDAETRDLLMRAACAAGIKVAEWVGDQANVEMDGGHYGWNPLATWGNGEALSLAVKLRLGLIPLEGGGWDVVRFDSESCAERPLATCANSGMWALQEAIVRAAAKLCPDGVPACPESGKHCNWIGGECHTCGITRGALDPKRHATKCKLYENNCGAVHPSNCPDCPFRTAGVGGNHGA